MVEPVRESEPPYQGLTPEKILDAVETTGRRCDGRLLALNSYENRVYQVGIEEEAPLVAKFYRPGRWSDAAILEEHAFAWELAEREIPVVPPLRFAGGATLLQYQGFRFALFERRGGRAPSLDDPEHITWLGRFLGRIHAVGAITRFRHRPVFDVDGYGGEAVRFLQTEPFLPDYLRDTYRTVSHELLGRCREAFAAAAPLRLIRLHGDCHPGNILWRESGPHFVDLDDCRTGPAIQDLWMLLSGSRAEMEAMLRCLLDGYGEFADFDPVELGLVESLRALRMLHYAAWIARRWHDPAFPLAFPWFNTPRYWEDHVHSLREQLERLDEPPLSLR